MKTIKYKFWVYHLNYMCEVLCIDFEQQLVTYRARRPDLEYTSDITSGELLQHTGLKDKNGKEIFEKDIIRFKDVDGRVRSVQILFSDYRYGAAYEEPDLGGYIRWFHPEYLNDKEVVGTVFENKGLLDENN